MMLNAIMSSPDFGEVCFLVALILFVIATVVALVQSTVSAYVFPLVAAGLSFLALAFLAL